jgi:phosphoenolpyruvate carboxykinase (GTP)
LKWIFERTQGTAEAVDSPIGMLPAPGALDLDGLDLSDAAKESLLAVDVAAWRAELDSIEEHFARFGDRLPAALRTELENLRKRLA